MNVLEKNLPVFQNKNKANKSAATPPPKKRNVSTIRDPKTFVL